MIRRLGLGLLVLLALGSVVAWSSYRAWLQEVTLDLVAGAEVVDTRLGKVEVSRAGKLGPTVLLIHGTPGGYDQLLSLAAQVEAAGYRSLAVSRPGYLRTPLSVGRTPAEQADAYAALLDALRIPSAAIVGVSGGGPSSLEFAKRPPDRCWALVDLMGVSRAPRDDEMGPLSELEGSLVERVLSSNAGGWMLSRLLALGSERVLAAAVPDPDNAARIRDDPAKMASFRALLEGGFRLAASRAEGTRNDQEQFFGMTPIDLAAIRVPTQVLHGTADENVPFAMGREVAEAVPGAELVRFEGADHMMVVSHSEEVFAAMFGFLDRNRPN